MSRILVFMIDGSVAAFGTWLLLLIVKKLDAEKKLPDHVSKKFYSLCFTVGIYIGIVSKNDMIKIMIESVILMTMAYTDFYEKKIYNFCNLLLTGINLVWLYLCCDISWAAFVIYMLVCIIAASLMKCARVFADGDQWMLMGMAVCFYGMTSGCNSNAYVIMYCYVMVSLFLVLVINLKTIITKGARESVPYAPAGMVTYLIFLGIAAFI